MNDGLKIESTQVLSKRVNNFVRTAAFIVLHANEGILNLFKYFGINITYRHFFNDKRGHPCHIHRMHMQICQVVVSHYLTALHLKKRKYDELST